MMPTSKTRRTIHFIEAMMDAGAEQRRAQADLEPEEVAATLIPRCGAPSEHGPCEGVRGHVGWHIAGEWIWKAVPREMLPATVRVVR